MKKKKLRDWLIGNYYIDRKENEAVTQKESDRAIAFADKVINYLEENNFIDSDKK